LIVALRTYDENENIDHWLTMYDRDLTPIQDGEVLITVFAKIA
jgi:serine/threonine protein kinase